MLDREILIKILDDYKTSRFISVSLNTLEINHVDFYDSIEDEANEDLLIRMKRIETLHFKIFGDEISKRAIDGVERGSEKVYVSEKTAMEILRAGDRTRYTPKIAIEKTTKIENLSDDELNDLIEKLNSKNS